MLCQLPVLTRRLLKKVAARRGVSFLNEINGSGCPNSVKRPIEIIGGNRGLSNSVPTPENENPGALAGATGVGSYEQAFTSEDYRMRAQCATNLALAIGEAHPDDAIQLMTAALIDLTGDGLRCDVFLSAEEDSRWWASIATPAQLAAILEAVMQRLGDRAMHLNMRKRLLVAIFEGLAIEDRIAFLRRADPAGKFLRRAST